PKSHKSSGSYGDSVVVEEFQRTVKEEVALEKAKRQTKKKIRCKQDQCLDETRSNSCESITEQFLKERKERGEERGRGRELAKQMEERGRSSRHQDQFYKLQNMSLQERSKAFIKINTNYFFKIAEETKAEFKEKKCPPLRADDEAQILHCHGQITQNTISCQSLLSQYIKCANNKKQSMLSKGT
uniref:Coiled-coil-helix-coiled-coil-helix domain containing 3 n=1 Tax=Sus scrofa TaxID=9823 RepID=A0A8D1LBK0_PIG